MSITQHIYRPECIIDNVDVCDGDVDCAVLGDRLDGGPGQVELRDT